jgi:hypothetical protein
MSIIKNLEKQEENDIYKDTIESIIQQFDKYIEQKELYIRSDIEGGLRNYYLTYKSYKDDGKKDYIYKKIELESRFRKYSECIHDKIYLQNLKLNGEEIKEYFNIFEYIYKLLKYLFTSSKQISLRIDEIILRLNNLEKENNEIKHILNMKSSNIYN